MIIKSIIGTTCACLAVVSFNTSAALIERLGGLAYYDDVANLTWLADANAAGRAMDWEQANTWAAGLDIYGESNWRLPDTLQPDPTCSGQNGGDSFTYNCTGSEMGNLFYNVLGGSAGSSILTTHNANYNLFSNIQNSYYWSATEYASNTTRAWEMGMYGGDQFFTFKTSYIYAWAVTTGDVSAVPVPAAVWLFGSGLIGLIGVARRKKA